MDERVISRLQCVDRSDFCIWLHYLFSVLALVYFNMYLKYTQVNRRRVLIGEQKRN